MGKYIYRKEENSSESSIVYAILIVNFFFL